jgi:hypothetical protein
MIDWLVVVTLNPTLQFGQSVQPFLRSLHYMGYLERVLEKIKEWAERVIEVLLGPVAEPESEPIPIPVDDRYRRR